MKVNHLLLASMLTLASTLAVAQTGAKSSAPPPGHDMNEQNTNAPGMRSTMQKQQGGASKSKPAAAKGHDMNEQNQNAPGMREQMNKK